MSMCRVFSCVVGRGCLLWPVRSLGKTLLAFALLHFVFQGQICLLLQVFLDFLLLHSSPLQWKGHLLGGVSSKRSCRSSQNRSASASSALLVRALSWITVIVNGLPWKRTEIILSFLRLHASTTFWFFVDYDGYSISSMGFLPTVVDIMVICIKFTNSCPFSFTDS